MGKQDATDEQCLEIIKIILIQLSVSFLHGELLDHVYESVLNCHSQKHTVACLTLDVCRKMTYLPGAFVPLC